MNPTLILLLLLSKSALQESEATITPDICPHGLAIGSQMTTETYDATVISSMEIFLQLFEPSRVLVKGPNASTQTIQNPFFQEIHNDFSLKYFHDPRTRSLFKGLLTPPEPSFGSFFERAPTKVSTKHAIAYVYNKTGNTWTPELAITSDTYGGTKSTTNGRLHDISTRAQSIFTKHLNGYVKEYNTKITAKRDKEEL